MAEFRKAQPGDLPGIMDVIHQAQAFMATLGIDQWQDGYPTEDVIDSDIQTENLFGVYDDASLLAVCAVFPGADPVYQNIDGEWKNKGEYVTVHRMAVSDRARGKGAALMLMEKAFEIAFHAGASSVRVDTHLGNVRMRRFLEKQGFEECGIVDYSFHTNGDPRRIAYEKCL